MHPLRRDFAPPREKNWTRKSKNWSWESGYRSSNDVMRDSPSLTPAAATYWSCRSTHSSFDSFSDVLGVPTISKPGQFIRNIHLNANILYSKILQGVLPNDSLQRKKVPNTKYDKWNLYLLKFWVRHHPSSNDVLHPHHSIFESSHPHGFS